MKMYAQLGTIQFELLPIESIEEKYSYSFAEHQVIEGKPLLQYVGDNLDETSIGIRLHVSFCKPAKSFKALKDEAGKKQALPYFFADGTVCGLRVITEISRTFVQTADNGNPICIEAKLQLREWVDNDPLGTRQSAKQNIAPGLQGVSTINKAVASPGNLKAIVSGQITSGAKLMGQLSSKINAIGNKLKAEFPSLVAMGNQIKTAAQQISTAVEPLMKEAQSIAAEAKQASALIKDYTTEISGYCSNITRICSDLPGPAGKLSAQIAALNSSISGQATRINTLSSLTGGEATEAGTRAKMITRMLPK